MPTDHFEAKQLRRMILEISAEMNENIMLDPDVETSYYSLRYELGRVFGQRAKTPNQVADHILDLLRNDVYATGEFDKKLEAIAVDEDPSGMSSHQVLVGFLESIGPEAASDDLYMAHRALRPNEGKKMTRKMDRSELLKLIEACGGHSEQPGEELPQMLPEEPPHGVITKVQGAKPDHDGDGMGPDEGGRKLGNGGKSRMTRQQLYKIAEYGVDLWNMLEDEDEIPEWCQSKIAIISDAIGKVKHHLEYKIVKPEDGELELDND
tara:strand:- start:88 stop:882 length:795 start_codon:yes stop_codon:yes gene_type:complete